MRDVIDEIQRWIDAGEPRIALATVVGSYSSSPRGVGARMGIAGEGKIVGSISGGCVESAVIEEAASIAGGRPPKLLHFEATNERAWEVGLPCGGSIDVFVEALEPRCFAFLRDRIRTNVTSREATVIAGAPEMVGRKLAFDADGGRVGTIGEGIDGRVLEAARALERPGRITVDEDLELFVDVLRPAPTLFIVGGVHIAIALSRLAKVLGFVTVVIDPRKSFGNHARFPDVDRLVPLWPDEAFAVCSLTAESAVVLLTHDPKLDDPALVATLRSPVFYIGALGSARTQQLRRTRLLQLGFSPQELGRIHGPVGLDIGAATPEEIALAILAEIVAVERGARSPLHLRARIESAQGSGSVRLSDSRGG